MSILAFWQPVNVIYIVLLSFIVIVNVDLYSASTQTPLTRSDMDHTVLPANNTISAFTAQPQSITALWSVLIAPTHGGMARLS